jgi:hypothetical protein
MSRVNGRTWIEENVAGDWRRLLVAKIQFAKN